MPKQKMAITLDGAALARLDRLVAEESFLNRSQAIEAAVSEMLERLERGGLASECAKLDQSCEKGLAEERMSGDSSEWPEH